MNTSKNRKTSSNLKKGLFLLALLLLLSIGLFFNQHNKAPNGETKAKELEISDFNLAPQDSSNKAESSSSKLEAKTLANNNYQWQSQIYSSDFDFDALGAKWNKDELSNIEIYARFSKNKTDWENWQQLIVDDADSGNEKSLSAGNNSFEVSDLVFSKEAKYFQYKVVFQDRTEEAYLEKIKFTYIKAGAENKKFSLSNYLKTKKAMAVNSPRVISRAEWGANPAYMTWDPEYVRPNKIIIHHTASGNNPPDPAAVVRSIYYYHAVSLGWGDIGYNYLFDQYGNIYEGRAGGNMVVGAHTYGQNYGSVGFSVIGEYTYVDITPATLNAITDLVAFKAYQNDFAINWNTIFGHRDFCNNPPGHNCTACPGNLLYSHRLEIINLAIPKENTFLEIDRNFLNQNNNILVKSYSSPDIYFWSNNQKRKIVDMASFVMLGYSMNDLNYISSVVLAEKVAGENITALMKTVDSSIVYLISRSPDLKYRIADINVFNAYGFNLDNVAITSQEYLDSISNEITLRQIIKSPDNPNIYRVLGGQKNLFADPLAYKAFGYNFNDAVDIKGAFISLFPQGGNLYNIIKGSSNDNLYLLQSQAKHFIPNPSIYLSWGFNWNKISTIAQNEIDSFGQGVNLKRIAKNQNSEAYLIDGGKKFIFPSLEMLGRFGETIDSSFPAENELIDILPLDGEAGDVIRSSSNVTAYQVMDGKKFPFPDPATYQAWGNGWDKIKIYSDGLVASIPTGTTLRVFIQKENYQVDPTIYLVSNGKKRIIPDMETFYSWGGDLNNVARLPDNLINLLPSEAELSYLIKGSADAIYLLDNGKKNEIPSLDIFNAWGFNLNNVATISDSTLAAIPTGQALGVIAKANNSDFVYQVEAGKKSLFPNPSVFYAWGYSFSQVRELSPLFLDNLSNNDNLTIFARASLVDPVVYLLNINEKKAFPDPNVLNDWGGTSKVVVSSYLSKLSTGSAVTSLIKTAVSPDIYLLHSGQKYRFASWADFTAFNYNLNNLTTVSQYIISSIGGNSNLYRLIKGTPDTVYYMENGKRRPIPDLGVFQSFGWSFSQVTQFDDAFVNSFPLGPMILANTNILSIKASGPYRIATKDGATIANASANDNALANWYGNYYVIGGTNQSSSYAGNQPIRFEPQSGSIIEVASYYDPNWNRTVNYNRFRGTIELYHSTTGAWVLNELPLNDYTAGICEAPGGHTEYLKTMAVAARSYGLWHLSRGGKYPAEPFHLKNSRRGNGNDQIYCGYNFESLASQYAPQARATDSQAVLYGGNPALTAYSHGSYPRTLSAQEVWGTSYAWLQSVPDPYGDPNRPCGSGGNHCVGLSASGAIGYAERGSNYQDILRHYYSGASINSISNQNIRIAIYVL